jgi:hypothetical protein
MRQRLSWDKEKVAEIEKQADPYTMNQTRSNPPVEKYHTGDPDAWGETPNMNAPWKNEGRTETGHPAPGAAREAVVAARKLEDKAIKCLTIAQRMLPAADQSMLEEQATDLMYLPEKAILATLNRQASIAEKLASGSKCEKDPEEVEEKEAAKKDPEEEVPEEKEAAKKEEVVPPAEEETTPPVEKKKAEQVGTIDCTVQPAGGAPAPMPAAPMPEGEEVEAKAKKEPEEKEIELDAKSAGDVLDQIFAQEMAQMTPKLGAKKLSGLVKAASEGDLSTKLWDAPPDVSKAFKR